MQHRSGPRPAAFALCATGVGELLRREATRRGMNPAAVTNDGRADVVPVQPPAWEDLLDLRGAEAICADLGTIRLLRSVRATAAQISESRLEATISDLRRRGLLSGAAPLRLVVRLQNEGGYSRSALRDAVARRLHSRVTRGFEHANEVWLIQDARQSLRVGLRVTALEPRRPPKAIERPGSLRPSVAAAMVGLGGRPGRLLDPCCGSGTILGEAQHAGWFAVGGDHAIDAVEATSANLAVDVVRLDARRTPFRDNEFDVVISNLPFGHQYDVQGTPVAWYRRTLTEALRVAPRAIVLAPASPPFRQALGRLKITLTERHHIEVLGRPATVWVIERGTV